MSTTDFPVGTQVIFGLPGPNAEKSRGTVIGYTRGGGKLKVRLDEPRGRRKQHRVGSIWKVLATLCRKLDAPQTAPTTPIPAASVPGRTAFRTTFRKGGRVTFTHKGQRIVGYVKRVNQKTVSVTPEGRFDGRYFRVPHHLLQTV